MVSTSKSAILGLDATQKHQMTAIDSLGEGISNCHISICSGKHNRSELIRTVLLLFLLTFFTVQGRAQVRPTSNSESRNPIHLQTLQRKESSPGTRETSKLIETIGVEKNDSLRNFLNDPDVKIGNTKVSISQHSDSIQKNVQSIQTKTTDQVQQRLGNLSQKINNPADSLQQKLNGATQSIQDKATDQVSRQVESVTSKLTSPTDTLQQALNGSLESVQDKIRSPIDSLQRALNIKAPTDLNVPGANLNLPGNLSALPGVNTAIPSANLPTLAMPGVEIPTTGLPAEGLKTTSPSITLPATTIPDLSVQQGITIPKVDELPGVKDINQVNGQVDQVGGQLQKAGEIQGDLKNIQQGKLEEVNSLPKLAEDQALKAAELNQLKADADRFKMPVDQYKALIEKYNDKKRLQDEIKTKSALVVNDLLQKNMPIVLETQQNMSKAKRIYGSFQSIKNLPLKPPNEMKDKPFRKRIVPGIYLQIYQSDHVVIDFAPSLAYRFTGRLTAGLNYSFRLGFSDDYQNYIRNENVSGARAFAQFTVLKGFFAHGDMEVMNAKSSVAGTSENSNTVFAAHFGVGKNFSISKRFKGNVIGLYRKEFSGTLPGQNTFNLRIGFSYDARVIRRLGK